MPLTDVSVRKAKGRATAYKLADGGGLYVLVRSSDARYWRMDYRWGGKRRTLALGVYPMVSLAEARKKGNQAKKLLASGIDPSAQRKLEGLLAKAAAGEHLPSGFRGMVGEAGQGGPRSRYLGQDHMAA